MPVDAYAFHGYLDLVPERQVPSAIRVQHHITSHVHPYVAELLQRLATGSLAELQAADTDPALDRDILEAEGYAPSRTVVPRLPRRDVDFASDGAYAVYNWELFFHAPLLIAIHLSKNQRYEEAQRWFHYVFDPTDDSEGETPRRFWKVKPFQTTDIEMIADRLVRLARGDAGDPDRARLLDAIQAWKDAPFSPHAVARSRPAAYMRKTVMSYLDNLIAWGDSLFREDTRESINEATQLYVLAADLLGPRPQPVPRLAAVAPATYAGLRARFDEFDNALIALESAVALDVAPHPTSAADDPRAHTLRGLIEAPYFCVPPNDKLLGYWDIVADRLFKIHNSLNLQGVFRQLPLFAPPIDPALLARAAAEGIDVAAVVTGATQPLPLVRYAFLAQRAAEICQHVQSLGNSLLAAMEKEDNEALAILRARHERVILSLVKSVKYQQWQEAIKAREALEKSLDNAVARHGYYERLLGREGTVDSALVPIDPSELDAAERAERPVHSTEPDIPLNAIAVDAHTEEGSSLSAYEQQELDRLAASQDVQDIATGLESTGALLNLIPMVEAKASPLGVGTGVAIGGTNLSQLLSGLAGVSRGVASRLAYEASRSARMGGHARRTQEWTLQSNLAAGDIMQIHKQLRAAQLREQIAHGDWRNHLQQIAHAEEIERFLTDEHTGKHTNQAFYTWLKREVKGLYAQCFQFAFDVAKKAERALQHELGDPDLRFIQFGYLAGRDGLLAGDKLYLDLKRMDVAYHDLNQREYELTRHVSLKQLAPLALLELQRSGRCEVALPEELFDMDGPGHYFRRMRAVALSLPCVAGPYTSVSCALTLQRSSIRTRPVAGGGYARAGVDDARFSDELGGTQTVVTSTGHSDGGVFDGVRDERYLPFEGHGAISRWQLQLPASVRQFDYATIADAILHIRYTAREGGDALRSASLANLEPRIDNGDAMGSTLLFSIRHDFPSEWARFRSADISGGREAALAIALRDEHFPLWSRSPTGDRQPELHGIELLARTERAGLQVAYTPPVPAGDTAATYRATFEVDEALQLARAVFSDVPLPAAPGSFALALDDNALDELWLAVTWGRRRAATS